MKQNGCYRDLPQDIRPMGTNNLNQLVHHHLGSESFDVVAQVRHNLIWLHELYQNLPTILHLGQNARNLDILGSHSKHLFVLAESLSALKEIYCNLDSLKALSKVGVNVDKRLTALDEKLSVFHGQVSEAAIDNLLERYSELEKKLANTEQAVNAINTLQNDVVLLNKALVHMQASDAVNAAIYTKESKDIDFARRAIKASVDAGNNERINSERLDDIDG